MPRTPKFAATLRAAMRVKGFSKSELARRVWGTTKDTRGYDVARNRDRIGHYLNGTSYPEPDNLVKLAEALGVAPEQLLDPARRVGTDRKSVPTERPHMEKTWEVRSMDKADPEFTVVIIRAADGGRATIQHGPHTDLMQAIRLATLQAGRFGWLPNISEQPARQGEA
jgi:transcriptional regulator with XRE-family HTH domain